MIPAGALASIKSDEGCRLAAYPDPVSKGDPWTIGYGATGPLIERGTLWTQTQAGNDLTARVSALCDALDEKLPWWRSMNDARQSALVNLAYNLGLAGLLGFHQTLGALQVRNYALAADHLLESRAAAQLPARYGRLAKQLRTGAPPNG